MWGWGGGSTLSIINFQELIFAIIESIDSISKDCPYIPIIMHNAHYKSLKT